MTTWGEQLKLEGMTRAVEAVEVVPWSTTARAVLDDMAASGVEFTADDLVAIVGLPRREPGINRNNAVGAVISGAARSGVIRRVGYRTSKRPNQHAANLAIWVGA